MSIKRAKLNFKSPIWFNPKEEGTRIYPLIERCLSKRGRNGTPLTKPSAHITAKVLPLSMKDFRKNIKSLLYTNHIKQFEIARSN